MNQTIFAKIIHKEIAADILYEDDLCLAFRDINPIAPQHILLIPKITDITNLLNAQQTHQSLLGHLLLKAPQIAKQQGLDSFRLVINNGSEVGQTVFHLHLHILGGRDFSWPPG